METTRLSAKGQIILPKSVRDQHHWTPGTDFTVEDTGDGVLLRPVRPAGQSRLQDVAGSLRGARRARCLADMDAAVTAEIQARRGRGRY